MYIPISSISALCGRNPYCSTYQATREVLERYNKSLFDKLTKEYYKLYHEEYKSDLVDKNIRYQQFKSANPNFVEKVSNTDDIGDMLNKLPKDISSKILMERGAKREEIIRNMLSKKYRVEYDNSMMYKSFEVNGISYKIGGRVDLFLLNDYGNRIGVFEIKSRRSLKKEIPSYDIDQIAGYRVVSGLFKFALVEEYNLKLRESWFTINTLDNLWIEMKPKLDSWVLKMKYYENNPMEGLYILSNQM
jgi:hypothetical protein